MTTDALARVRALLVDMDGVLYRGDQVLPGASELFPALRALGIGFVLITNNSSRTQEQYEQKLQRMGVPVRGEEVLTSGQATALYLARDHPPGTRVFVIGMDGLVQPLRAQGYILTDQEPEVVVVGFDSALTYDKLVTAHRAIRRGARYVGTNPDPTLPTPDGDVPGSGSFHCLLSTSTGVRPTIVGKPHPPLFEMGLARLGTRPEETAIVGDRLDTDIQGGRNVGLVTMLVLSGSTTIEQVAQAEQKPDYVFPGLPDLIEALYRSRGVPYNAGRR